MASVKSKPPEGPKPTKRTPRSGIRQSFNLASVGKALADVMNKEKEKEKEKSKEIKDAERKRDPERRSTASTKGKDDASRRTGTITSTKEGSTLDSVSDGQAKDGTPPDQKTVTNARKTNSSLQRGGRSSVDEAGVRATSAITTPTGAAQTTTNKNLSSLTLRPRKPATNSALPKYRPTSVIVEGSAKESRAAVRIGSRRKHSTSEEDKDNSSSETKSINDIPVNMDKANRPISPLPRRASQAGDQSRPGSVECSKRLPLREPRSSMEGISTTSTPPRKKAQRPSLSPALKKSALPRPSPRGDTSSESPHTPSSAKKIVSRYLSGLSGGRESPSPLRASVTSNGSMRRYTITSAEKVPIFALSDSNENTPPGPQSSGTRTQSSTGNDSADDVEMMLAAVASPSAPTPALPRIGLPSLPLVSTPSKKSMSILDLSLGLSTPQSERLSMPSSRRSTPNRRPTVDRNSTVAWQALADLSLEINTDQIQGGLIKELDLPATPLGLISPSPSITRMESDDGHERSPTPLNMPSPSKYGSISQLLLPTVTPPLGKNHSKGKGRLQDLSSGSDGSAAESAAVTLLKLQLASMENIAKERLVQISKLEGQMHTLKESRKRDERELLTHVNELEQRLHEALASQQRAPSRFMSISSRSEASVTNDEEDAHAISHDALEERIHEVEVEQQETIREALIRQAERERSEQARLLRQVEQQQRVSLAMRDAKQRWAKVHDIANGELEAIRANRETLAVLCATLDFYENQIHPSRFTRVPTYVARLALN